MPVRVDYSYYLVNETPYLEIFYEIPYSSLIFIKEGKDFITRYDIKIFGFGKKKDFILLDQIKKEVKVSTYEETKGEKQEEGKLTLSCPLTVRKILLTFKCLNSDLAAEISFPLKEKKEVFLQKGEKVTFSERLSWEDTLSLYLPPSSEVSSYQISLRRGKKEVFNKIIPVGERFSEPLINFSTIFNDTSGIYHLKVLARGKKGFLWQKEMPIFITVSPFLSNKEWQRRVYLLFPIASEEEIRELKITPQEKRSDAWQNFWEKKEIKEDDYFSRVEYCLKNFSFGDKGLASDRAKIYLKYGQPDTIEEYPYETNKKPYIIWRYDNLGLAFTFVDLRGIGEYVLVK
ncbi:MAG: GWxTD domain-containing protein [candidate division WOR-3 bacterium]